MFKRLIVICLLLISVESHAQNGFQLGLEISPAWNLNTHYNKILGFGPAESGYGFNVGVPVKWWFKENISLQTGLTFEYMAFDNRVNNTLLSSQRHGSVNLPLMFNLALSGSWYASFGAGLKYNFLNQAWSGFSVDISSQINSFQPYFGGGVNTLIERDKGVFEFGIQGRYHFIQLLNETAPQSTDFSSNILSLDLILRFYLLNR